MGANKYENFECVVVKRSDIHGADYNPRTITESALKKLRKWFKTEGKGQLAPITVNKNTMTVVSGHQRLTVLDQLNKYPDKDYQLTVAMTDLDEKTEVEANVFMNNKSAMGDFDYDMLKVSVPMGNTPEAAEIMEQAKKFTDEDYRTARKKELQKVAEGSNTQGSVYLEKDDYTFTVVCISNDEKHKLMRLLHERESEKFIKSNKLYDIYDHKIKLRELS